MIKDDELLEKYIEIWEKVRNNIKNESDSEPAYNKKYLKSKIKSYNGKIKTKFLQKLYVTKDIQDTVNEKQLVMVLAFLGAQSSLIRKRLQSCLRNCLPYCSLRIAFQSKTRLSSLFRFNYLLSKEISSHLVYKFTCSCCNATYYRESERHFILRASEHLGLTPLTGKRVKNPKSQLSLTTFCWRVMMPVYDSLERKQQI